LFSPFSLSLQIRAPLRNATTSSGYDSYHSPHRRCYMLHTLHRAAATNESLRTHHAPSQAATIHFINQHQYHHQKEEGTSGRLLHGHKQYYCHYHHHHPNTSSSTRGTISPRATTITDSNRYLWVVTWDAIRFSLNKNSEDIIKGCPQSNATLQNQSYADPWNTYGKIKRNITS
jgi:hypothetical protein